MGGERLLRPLPRGKSTVPRMDAALNGRLVNDGWYGMKRICKSDSDNECERGGWRGEEQMLGKVLSLSLLMLGK